MEEQVAALLRETGGAHHQAFIHVNGEDAEWSTWYARYLTGRLAIILGVSVDAGELARQLDALEAARQRDGDTDWPRYYAQRIVGAYARRG